MSTLLPAQRRWVEDVCLELLDGQIVVLRGLPGTGKSVLADAILRELGRGAMIIHGRSFNDHNQMDYISRIRDTITSSFQSTGQAQLVFDDYPHALRWSDAARLQATLLHALVDGPIARDTGALLTGRWARSMQLRVRGSPLLARAQFRPLPEIADADLEIVGIQKNDFGKTLDEIGAMPSLLARVRIIGGRPDYSAVRQVLAELASRWIGDLPWEAITWLRSRVGEPDEDLRSSLAWEAVQPLLTNIRPRRLLAGLRNSEFEALLEDRSPVWPSEKSRSVERFVDLINGVSSLIWVDRYLTSDPVNLYEFIQGVRSRTSTRLLLLTSSSLTSDAIRRNSDTVKDLARLDGIEIRSMGQRHYRLLHDRQLVFLGDREGGVVLPTTDVILGRNPVGSALAVQVPIVERALVEDAWAKGIPADRFLPIS